MFIYSYCPTYPSLAFSRTFLAKTRFSAQRLLPIFNLPSRTFLFRLTQLITLPRFQNWTSLKKVKFLHPATKTYGEMISLPRLVLLLIETTLESSEQYSFSYHPDQ